MEKMYVKNYKIDYDDIKSNYASTELGIMKILQEMAIFHSDYLGYDLDWFKDNMKGWVLSNWDINIYRFPKWKEELTVTTWVSKLRGIISNRMFEIKNNDERLVLASSKWAFTDLLQRKPVKPPQEFEQKYIPCDYIPYVVDYKMPSPEEFTFTKESPYVTNRLDVDTNLHINNISYLKWILPLVDKIHYEQGFKRIKITYKKECLENITIQIKEYRKENSYYFEICNDNDLLTQIYLEY